MLVARLFRPMLTRSMVAACAILGMLLVAACGGGSGSQATPAPSPEVLPSPSRPSLASPIPGASPNASNSSSDPTGLAAGEQTYTVQSGDSLMSISQQFYGDSSGWQRIYDANKDAIGPNPDALKLDTKLKIPPKS